jgi:hypothetical protein
VYTMRRAQLLMVAAGTPPPGRAAEEHHSAPAPTPPGVALSAGGAHLTVRRQPFSPLSTYESQFPLPDGEEGEGEGRPLTRLRRPLPAGGEAVADRSSGLVRYR